MARRTVTRSAAWIVALGLLLAGHAAAQEPNPPTRGAQVTLLHINDVYETMPIDGRGGLARIATLKRRVAASGPRTRRSIFLSSQRRTGPSRMRGAISRVRRIDFSIRGDAAV